MNFKNIIELALKNQKKDRVYLAEVLNIDYKSLCDKIDKNNFQIYDIFKISKVLKIDLNEIRDYLDIETGSLGIIEKENETICVTIHIDIDYYKTRKINIKNGDKALIIAIETALKELCSYINMNFQFESTDIHRLAMKKSMFSTFEYENREYIVAFSSDKLDSYKVIFDEESYIDHKIIL